MLMRVFEARPRPGRGEALAAKLATTSVDVVRGRPGNLGHLLGSTADGEGLLFISLWRDLEAVKARFGDDWDTSYLPPGYAQLIESCSIEHLEVSGELGAS
jgi:hypothetical protein